MISIAIVWILGAPPASVYEFSEMSYAHGFVLIIYGSVTPYIITITTTIAMCVIYSRNQINIPETVVTRMENHGKFIKMICLMLIGYSVTCLPFTIWLLVTKRPGVASSSMHDILLSLLAANGLVDVIVYGFMDKAYRCHLKALLPKRSCPGKIKNTTDKTTFHVNYTLVAVNKV